MKLTKKQMNSKIAKLQTKLGRGMRLQMEASRELDKLRKAGIIGRRT